MSEADLRHLGEVAKILDQLGVRWWVDSGTLLALYRDGRLFDRSLDKDFDIGICDSQGTAEFVQKKFSAAGYRVGKRMFDGHVVKLWIEPKRQVGGRAIDLKIYRSTDQQLICPVGSVLPLEHERDNAGFKFTRKIIGFIWRRRFRKSWRLPVINSRFQVITWVVPGSLLGATKRWSISSVDLSIPQNVEAYLEYRYGDWVITRSDWDTLRDDGGLRMCAPDNW